MRLYNVNSLRDRRKELRSRSTEQEKLLWYYLKEKKMGVRFRRQFSIGGYILDFYCPKLKLALEIDGSVHDTPEAKEYDRVRDKFMEGAGLKVIRFSNTQVEKYLQQTLDKIRKELE